ncbi:MAG: hypothetical protein QOE63_1478 [Acidimicrobiaceae bacterium]|jgi:LPXTG-motif cell wall-anchored protein
MTLGALLATAPARSAPALPPVQVSTTVLEPGGTIAVSGQGCTNTGLGAGYHVDVKRGDVSTEFNDQPPMSNGSFTASDTYDHLIPGHVTIEAFCFDGPQENNFNDPYPVVALDVRPPPDPPIESALSVSPGVAAPGDTVSVHSDGLRGGGLVTFYLYPSRIYIGEAQANPANAVAAQLTLPASAAGDAQIVAVSAYRVFGSGAVSIQAPSTEAPATEPPPTSSPPATTPSTAATSTTPPPSASASSSTSSSSASSSSSGSAAAVRVRDDKTGSGSSGALVAIGGGAIAASVAGLLLWRRRRGLVAPPP